MLGKFDQLCSWERFCNSPDSCGISWQVVCFPFLFVWEWDLNMHSSYHENLIIILPIMEGNLSNVDSANQHRQTGTEKHRLRLVWQQPLQYQGGFLATGQNEQFVNRKADLTKQLTNAKLAPKCRMSHQHLFHYVFQEITNLQKTVQNTYKPTFFTLFDLVFW